YTRAVERVYAHTHLRAPERRSRRRGVAYAMLGPPRLTKLRFESYLCSLLRPSVRALGNSRAQELASEAHALVERDRGLRSHILSVGIPILAPDGERLYRGSVIVVPGDGADPREAAPRGWVDLRPAQFATWIE